jgi:hypothetical protein
MVHGFFSVKKKLENKYAQNVLQDCWKSTEFPKENSANVKIKKQNNADLLFYN